MGNPACLRDLAVNQAGAEMTRDELEAAGAKLSGGPIRDFAGGWAIIPFGRRPHYWRPVKDAIDTISRRGRVHFYRALCGAEAQTYDGVSAIEEGAFRDERCRHCLRQRQKDLRIEELRAARGRTA